MTDLVRVPADQTAVDATLVNDLRKRVVSFKLQAARRFWLMALIILTGMATFLLAGIITEQLDERVLQTDRRLTDISSELEIDDLEVQGVTFLTDQKPTENEKILRKVVDEAIGKLKVALKINDSSEQRIKQLNVEIDRIRKSQSVDVNTISIRLAVTVLMIFLAQILGRSYQQCMALATFYDSRADMLVLFGAAAFNPDIPERSLFPGDVHFVVPKSPVQSLTDVATAAMTRKAPEPKPTSEG
jgi:hypothetical protein